MKEETEKTEQNENLFSPEVWAQFKRVKTEFSRNIAPKVKEGLCFWPSNVKKARKQKRSRKNSGFNCFVSLPPLAAMLSRDSLALQAAAQAVTRIRNVFPIKYTASNRVTTEKGKIVSVFVILEFQMPSGILKYHLQKIAKKSRPGFPGGEIKENEGILEAGIREVKEETAPDDDNGVDIAKYNPMEVAKFPLKGAVNEERGVILFAKIPESEIIKIKPGGGAKGEDELVAHVYLATAEQIEMLIARQEILPNSQNIWQIFKEFRNS